jgi:hypothetical protein
MLGILVTSVTEQTCTTAFQHCVRALVCSSCIHHVYIVYPQHRRIDRRDCSKITQSPQYCSIYVRPHRSPGHIVRGQQHAAPILGGRSIDRVTIHDGTCTDPSGVLRTDHPRSLPTGTRVKGKSVRSKAVRWLENWGWQSHRMLARAEMKPRK